MAKTNGSKKTLDDITANTDLAEIEKMIEIDPATDDKKPSEQTQMNVEDLITVNNINTIVDEKMKVTEVAQNDIRKYDDDSENVPENMVLMDEDEFHRQEVDKLKKTRDYDINTMMSEMDQAIASEEARVAALDNDEEYREAMTEAVASSAESDIDITELPRFVYDPKSPKDDNSSFSDIDDDFTPTFESFDVDEADSSEDDSTNDETSLVPVKTAESGEENFMKTLAELPVFEDAEDYEPKVITKLIRGKNTRVTNVNRIKDGGDASFVNAINELRKKNYPVVQVPLVNSGFFVDMVGTGAQDMIMLYSMNDRDSTAIKYEIDRMKAVMNGVVGTEPNVRPENLKNMIHYADYQMMVFGRLCATFNTLNSVGTCQHCGKDFRFVRKPETLLLNYDELAGRIAEMRNNPDITKNSLLSSDKSFEFGDSGIKVVLGHPDYISTVNMYNSTMKYLYPDSRGKYLLSEIERSQFGMSISIISIIRSLTLPNGVKAMNEYQKFLGLKMLTAEEFNVIKKTALEYTEQIITPKFGAEGLVCKNCGKPITVNFSNLEDMIFFHITVSEAIAGE